MASKSTLDPDNFPSGTKRTAQKGRDIRTSDQATAQTAVLISRAPCRMRTTRYISSAARTRMR